MLFEERFGFMNDAVPADIKTYITEKIASVERLEILLLMHTHMGRDWTAAAISQELRSNTKWVQSHLSELKSLQLISETSPGNYRVDENAPRVATGRQIVELYRERRVMVIDWIYRKPTERIKDLADVFRIRKDDNES